METKATYHCLNCNRPETAIPLVSLRYAGNQAWICSQCLPLLIHQPQQLASKLSGAEKFEPFQPHQE
jgi:hypothetical protein